MFITTYHSEEIMPQISKLFRVIGLTALLVFSLKGTSLLLFWEDAMDMFITNHLFKESIATVNGFNTHEMAEEMKRTF